MAEEMKAITAGNPRLRDVLVALAAAGIACCCLFLLFPGKTLGKVTHGLLHLPGPGSVVTVIFGPLLLGVLLLTFSLTRKLVVVVIAGCAFGLLHSLLVPLLFPGVKTVGCVGPLPLRILAAVVASVSLYLMMQLLRKHKRVIQYGLSAVAANAALAGFYWSVIYPNARKGWIGPRSELVLLITGSVSAFILAALASLAYRPLGTRSEQEDAPPK